MSGEENGDRQPLMIAGFLASIHVSTFYFKGADKGRMMLTKLPKCPLLAYFCPILASWGMREDSEHTSQQGPFKNVASADRPRAGMPAPLATPKSALPDVMDDKALLIGLSVV